MSNKYNLILPLFLIEAIVPPSLNMIQSNMDSLSVAPSTRHFQHVPSGTSFSQQAKFYTPSNICQDYSTHTSSSTFSPPSSYCPNKSFGCPRCQLCTKLRHTALACYNRHNPLYQASS